MAGFVASPDTIRVNLHWTWEGRPQLNVLHAHYTLAGPLNPNIGETIFASIKASSAWTQFHPQLSPDLVFIGVGVLDLRGPNIPEVMSTGAAVPGTGTGNAMPPNNSTVITLRTALTGRSFRGRVYLFGYVVGGNDPNGTISPGLNALAVSFVTAVQAAIATAGGQLAIRSPALPERPSKPGGTLPAKNYAITPVTQIVARDVIWDTNRRRLDIFHR